MLLTKLITFVSGWKLVKSSNLFGRFDSSYNL